MGDQPHPSSSHLFSPLPNPDWVRPTQRRFIVKKSAILPIPALLLIFPILFSLPSWPRVQASPPEPPSVGESVYGEVYRPLVTLTGKISAEAFMGSDQNGELRFQGDELPLPSVIHAVYGPPNDSHTVEFPLNPDGSFQLILPLSSVILQARVPGHLPQTIQVEATRDLTVTFPMLVAGDVNGDGAINLKDLFRLAKHFQEKGPWTDREDALPDLNRDQEVNLLDAQFILKNLRISLQNLSATDRGNFE
ncbi:MAG: hypothetical protein IMW85_00960 [Thermicanus sp.]|nr:hypothetical protein [Thermicanus sp.]